MITTDHKEQRIDYSRVFIQKSTNNTDKFLDLIDVYTSLWKQKKNPDNDATPLLSGQKSLNKRNPWEKLWLPFFGTERASC